MHVSWTKIMALAGPFGLWLAQSAWAGPTPEEVAVQRLTFGAVGLGVLMIIVGLVILLLAFKVVTAAVAIGSSEMAPRAFRRGRDIFGASPVKSFFVGLVNFVFAAFIGILLLQNNPAGALGAIFLGVLFLLFYYYSGPVRLVSLRALFAIVLVILFVAVSSGPNKQGPGTIVISGLLLLTLVSRAIVYQWLGVRMLGELVDPDRLSSLRARLWGAVVTELALLAPIVLLSFVVTMISFGALLLAILSGRRAGVRVTESETTVLSPDVPTA